MRRKPSIFCRVLLSVGPWIVIAIAIAGDSAASRPVEMTRISVPTLVAMPAGGPITIDGQVSEDAWKSATPAGNFRLELDASMAPEQPTAVRALWDRENLYLSFVCLEPNLGGLVVQSTKRDEVSGYEDRVEALIDPTGAGKVYYQFSLNPSNVQTDARYEYSTKSITVYKTTGPVEALKGIRDEDAEWDAKWLSAVAKGQGEWTAEIAIPLASLGIDGRAGEVLRVNLARNQATPPRGNQRRAKPDYSVWACPKGDIHSPTLFGVLAFADAAGKCPEVPTQFDVPLLGLPGQLGVPSDDRPAKSVRFQVHADRPARPFPRYWDSLNSTWSDEAFVARTYARGYVSKMRGGVSLGSMVSFEDGFLRTDFTRLDRFLDFIRKYRVQMVVNLSGGGPRGIEYKTQAGTGYSRGRNVPGPPAYREDYKLVHQAYLELFQYILDREGRDFFDSLRFELWNEPDGTDRFFAGTVDDYCELYDWVAKALKDVSATGKIGGPAVTGGGYTFTRDFLNHCRDGANAATGGRGAPVDFVSFHVYGWRWQLTPSALAEAVNTIVHFWKIISDAGFGGVEVNVTEWGIEPTGEAYGPYFWFRTNHYAPVWMAKFIKDIEDAKATYADLKPRVDSLSLCNFAMNNPEPFAGQRTLFTGKWIPKPYFNSYIVLNELGNERLEVTGIDSGPIGCIATKRPDGSLAILVFHFREYAKTSPPEEDIAVELAGLSLAGKKVFQMRVDKNTSNSHTAWVEMGSPRELTDEITEKLKAAAVVEKTPLDSAGGVIKLNMPVTSVAVVLIEDGK